ncbi:hypothetical protein M2392_004163 [Pseudomonas grimontii]|jgi:hypothetical protein|nr:hypothetical protein [Pseudomonas grimontii]
MQLACIIRLRRFTVYGLVGWSNQLFDRCFVIFFKKNSKNSELVSYFNGSESGAKAGHTSWRLHGQHRNGP